MKKIYCFLLLLCFPFLVSAATVKYDVEQFLVDAQILENGDMFVQELLLLDGTFNGYIRDITYKNSKLKRNYPINFSKDAIYNGTDITDVTIKAKKVNHSISYATFNESFDYLERTTESIAKNVEYVPSRIYDGYSYKMYYKANNEKVVFYLSYVVKDVVVLHEDVAELYYTFIGDAFDDPIGNAQIRVTLPNKNQTLRVWAHGELTGEIDKISDSAVEAKISKLSSNSPVDIRLTFSKNVLNSFLVTKTTEEEALPSILEVEEKRAEEANQKRKKAKRVVLFCTISSVLYLVFLILWWIYVYFKYDKEYKALFDMEYNREFIDDYNVEVVEYLMKQKIGENAFSASILNLVYKKNIKFEELVTDKKKKEYQFTLLNKDHLNETEINLVNFLFDRVGKEGVFTTKDLKDYASSTKTYTAFQSSYNKWIDSARKDAKKEQFFETVGVPFLSSFLFLIVGIFILSYSASHETGLILPFLCGGLSVIFLFYCAFMKKRTKKGAEHYARWNAFKKFLEDFGTFDVKELPEIVLWERYLVYATVFGIADKVQASMNVKIKEFNLSDATYASYYPSWIDYSIASSINRSIHDSFTANRETYSREMASSRSSSGSGGGGGFSSGGGFGGGGGGGRGF